MYWHLNVIELQLSKCISVFSVFSVLFFSCGQFNSTSDCDHSHISCSECSSSCYVQRLAKQITSVCLCFVRTCEEFMSTSILHTYIMSWHLHSIREWAESAVFHDWGKYEVLCTAYYDLLEAGFSLLLLQTTGLDLTFKQPLPPHHKYQLGHHLFVVHWSLWCAIKERPNASKLFTFMQLADSLIQSNINCIHAIVFLLNSCIPRKVCLYSMHSILRSNSCY